MESLESGFILFDDPDIPEGGWVCVHGHEPYRISSLSSLGNQAVFWSNMRFKSAFQFGLLNHAYLRVDSFFRLPADSIMREVGGEVISPQNKARWMASIFHFVNRISSGVFGFQGIPIDTLRNAIRESILPFDTHVNKNLIDCVRDSRQEYSLCDRQQRPNTSIHALWVPRLKHAYDVLNKAYPLSWAHTVIPKKNLPKKDANLFSWLSNLGAPALIKVNILGIKDRTKASLFGHGSFVRSTHNKRRNGTHAVFSPVRQWVTSYDLMAMDAMYTMEVLEALVFTDVTIPVMDNPLVGLFFSTYSNPLHMASYSLGIVADALWTAYSTSLSKNNLQETENPASPFVRSIDRGLLLNHVYALSEAGFAVHGFGTGRIHVAVDNDDETERQSLLDYCLETGLMPPAWMAGQAAAQTWQGDDPVISAFQTAIYIGDMANLVFLDNYVVGE